MPAFSATNANSGNPIFSRDNEYSPRTADVKLGSFLDDYRGYLFLDMVYMVNEVAEAGYRTDLCRELAQIDEVVRKAKQESELQQGDPWVQMGNLCSRGWTSPVSRGRRKIA
jgi:hypothetical protein